MKSEPADRRRSARVGELEGRSDVYVTAGEGTDGPILVILLACVLSSVVLAGLGLWLKKTKRLTSSRAALAWAILSIIPLIGAGFAMMAKHNVDQLTGETRSGVNEPPPTR